MFIPENRIIIVDDLQKDLDTLSKPFHDNGIGCRCFLYNVSDNFQLKNVRIAFFDIHLNPSGGGSAGQKLNTIATAIKQYVHIDNGPFALIFWTKNKSEINEIKKYIHERHNDCPKPFLVDLIDKDEFLDNPESLTPKLEQLLSDETLQILFEFENVAAKSAAITINQLNEIIPRNDTWGETENFKQNFEKVFSKIAIKNLGYEYAKENPDKGVISSLLPILNYHIESLHNSGQWKNYLKSLVNSKSSAEINYPADFSHGKLNSIFHIEKSNGDKKMRGAVIRIEKTNQEILTSLNISNIDAWFDKLIPFKSSKEELKLKIRNEAILVAVEISASCDFSNNKTRLNKYALGFIIPEIDSSENVNKSRTESSYHVGETNFHYDGFDFQIWLNLNFVIGTMPNDIRLGDTMFVLKKEIMDMIGNKYANHISRIGITSF